MEVAAALQSFVVLLEDDDPRKRADIYTEDATFVMPGTPLIQGRAEMLRRLENGTVLRSVTLTPSTIEARDDLARLRALHLHPERQPRDAPVPHGVAQAD
jgi:ketosteroid isomerase-like protein